MSLNTQVTDQHQAVFEKKTGSDTGLNVTYPTLADIPAGTVGLVQVGDVPSLINNVLLLTTNTAAQNTAIIQAALDAGGNVNVIGDGIRLINATLIIKSNTSLALSPDLILKLAPNTNTNMLRNAAWSGTGNEITAISVTNPAIIGTAAVRVTATITAHRKAVGDSVFIHGVTPDIYNGIWTVETVPSANQLTYILAYDVGDSIAAGAGTQTPYIHPTAYSTASVITTSGSASATGANFSTAWVGLTLRAAPIFPYDTGVDLGVIQSVESSSALTLVAVAPLAYSGVFTLLNPVSMAMRNADVNITVSGGAWDYDGKNQSTPDTFLKHGIYLRRVGNLNINSCSVLNVTKYALALGNIFNGLVENITLDTFSDGVHWTGSGDNLVTRNIYGKAGDDFTVAGNSDYYFYLDPQYVIGDFGTIRSFDLKMREAFSGFKFFGVSTNTVREITLEGISGYISGGSAVILIINDASCNGCEAGGAKAERVVVTGTWDSNSSKAYINVSGGITVDYLCIPNLVCGLGNIPTTSNGIYIGGAVVNNFIAGVLRFYASNNSASNTGSTGIYIAGTGRISRAVIGSISGKNINQLIQMSTVASSVTSDETIVFNVGQLFAENCAGFINSFCRMTLVVGTASRRGYIVQVHFSFADFTKLTVGGGYGLDVSPIITIAAGKNIKLNAPTVGVDPAVLGGGYLSGERGCQFMNSAAAAGTLQQHNVALYNPATSKWVQLTNNALVYP